MAGRASGNSAGFTTDYFGRCAGCDTPINPEEFRHVCVKCARLIFRVKPQPKQKQFIDAILATGRTVPTRLGMGGSRGGAKSRCLRDTALVVASEIPRLSWGRNIIIYIVRSVWGDVEKNHVIEYEKEHVEMMDWYKSKYGWDLPADMGSGKILCAYGDTFKDLRRFTRGPNVFVMLIDQAESFSEEELDELHTPNRWPEAEPGCAKTGYFFNPGGRGAEFLNQVFVTRDNFPERMRKEDFFFIQAFGWDNYDGWFANGNVMLNGQLLDREAFYALPGEIPPCPSGIYDQKWLDSVPDHYRFKLFVTQTSEGVKMWSKPDSIRLGELFGRFDVFAGQAFAGAWRRDRIVLSA